MPSPGDVGRCECGSALRPTATGTVCDACGRTTRRRGVVSVTRDFHATVLSLGEQLAATGRCFWSDIEGGPVYLRRAPGDQVYTEHLALERAAPMVMNMLTFETEGAGPPSRQVVGAWLGALLDEPTLFPRLRYTTRCPEVHYGILASGEPLVLQPGYNAGVGVWYEGPRVEPGESGALDEMLDLVPWEDGCSRENFLAALYGLFCPQRAAPYPIVLVLGDTQGAGKSSVVQLLSMIGTGVDPQPMSWRRVGMERATDASRDVVGAVRDGQRVLWFDNLKGRASSSTLCAIATSGQVGCSSLYRIGRTVVKNTFVLALTSNFASVDGDLAARACVVKLTGTRMTQAWKDRGYRYWRRRRHELVGDVLARLVRIGDGETAPAPLRFPEWWAFGCAALGKPFNPQAPHYRYRDLDYEVERLVTEWVAGEPFTEEELFGYAVAQRSRYPELMEGVRDVRDMRRRLRNRAGQRFFCGAAGVRELRDAGGSSWVITKLSDSEENSSKGA